jgi:hypothetical protein
MRRLTRSAEDVTAMLHLRSRSYRLWLLLAVALTVLAAGCSSSSPSRPTSNSVAPLHLSAELASYDLAAGPKTRFMVGLVASDNRLVNYGTVRLGFAYLGKDKSATTGKMTLTATGRYLPVPGSPPAAGRPGPVLLPPSQARGVYAAEVNFNKAGYWGAVINADLHGQGTAGATTTFQVRDRPAVPAVGDPAPKTRNLTLAARDAPKAAIDSRATTDSTIPDPDLHQSTIAAAIANSRPVVAVFATPVYCLSRFCGPITDMVADLAPRYPKVDFVHIEIWRSYDKRQLNQAAAQWLLRNGDLQEPWVFVIGPDGKIAARLDNLATAPELEAALKGLPTRP